MPRRMTSPVLVGRSETVGQVREALDATRTAQPRHLVIGGEAGVGKTRMLAEARDHADANGMRVLLGGCVSMGQEGLPFAPYTEIIRSLVAADGVASVSSIAGRTAPDLARLVPALGAGVSAPEQPLLAQTRLYEALYDLFHRLAERTPLVIQIEDMHWADGDTFAATSFLLRAIQDEPIAIIATFRADEVTRRHPLRPWLAEVGRDADVERIDLVPLGEEETGALVRQIIGEDLHAGELAEIQLRSDGNPFFIEELLAARQQGGEVLPSSLRDVLVSRIDALPDGAQRLLGVAAVGGRVVEHETLVAVADQDEAEIAGDLRQLVEAGLLVPTRALDDDDAYGFRHALLLEAVYDGLLPTERRRLHQAWGDALAAHETEADTGAAYLLQLSHHWQVARDERALAATIAGADASMRGYSFEMAANEYDEALSLWIADDARVEIDHVELLERTARASYLASRYRDAVAICREALDELGEADLARRTGLLVLLGRTLWVSGDWGGAVPVYEQALATAPDEPPIIRVKALAGLGQAYMLQARFSEARPLCEEAIAGAVAIGDRVTEGHGRNTLGLVQAGLGEVDAGNASIDEALKIALEVGNADDIGRAYVNRADIESWGGYPDTAFDTALEGMEVTKEWGILASYGAYLGFGAVSYGLEAGRWDEAAEVLARADRVAGPTEGTYVYRASYVLEYMACIGDPEFEAFWNATRQLLLARPASDNHGFVYMAGIQHAAFEGRFDEAIGFAWEGIDVIETADAGLRLVELARVAAWPVAEAGRAARRAGDDVALSAAREGMARLLHLIAESQIVAAEPEGRLARVLALDAHSVEAERSRLEGEETVAGWQAIADSWAELGRPYRSAMARWRTAEAAETADDRATAASHLRDAYTVAAELGARPLLRQLETMAKRLRVRLDAGAAKTQPGPDSAYSLTPREREVLAEVAAGRTNKEIAGALFISESTAGVHVSNILGKLGVSTRTEAARVALDQGLVS